MHVRVKLLLASAFLAGSAAAQQPPIIDRELFFGDPEISGAEISPDGKYIAFLKPLNKTRNIWVKRTDEPFDKARPITNDTKVFFGAATASTSSSSRIRPATRTSICTL